MLARFLCLLTIVFFVFFFQVLNLKDVLGWKYTLMPAVSHVSCLSK